nr:DNA adenine methylase [uncultured Anaeromusa sp.]
MSEVATVLRWPGSKWRLAEWIVSHMPPHKIYLEPFFGSGAVFFNKPESETETINDIDGNVVNLFKAIRDNPLDLAEKIEMTPWAREEYVKSYEQAGSDDVEKARLFLVRCWQAFGAKTCCKTGWAFDRSGTVYKPNLWRKLPKRILDVADRLKSAQIENMEAVKLIEAHNRENTLIYADPPYMASTRRNSALYACEMGGQEEHERLLKALISHSGPVLLSGYNSELYSDYLVGWERMTMPARTEKGLAAEESLWLNRKASMYATRLFAE